MSKHSYKPLFLTAIISIIIFSCTIVIFVLNFKNQFISDKTEHWGHLGDFIGGIINPIFAMLNLFALIYLSIKVYNLDELRYDNSIKPLGVIKSNVTENSVSIVFENCGLGPLIIEDIKITYNNKIYDKYLDFVTNNDYLKNNSDLYFKGFELVKNKSSLKSGGEILLLSLSFNIDSKIDYQIYLNSIIEELNKSTLKIIYKDINGKNKLSIDG